MANTISATDLGNDTTNQNNQQNQAAGQSQNNATPAGQAPSQTSGNAPAITSGNVNNPNQQKGSGFTNIQSVLKANQGNQLGSAVGNNLQQTTSSAQQNLQNAQGQFNTDTQNNQANTQGNQQLAQNVLNDATSYVGSGANAGQGQQFQNLLSGQYQGPTGLNNVSQLQNQAANAAQQGQALGTAGGRIGLLQQMAGNQQYGAGAANLDNLLLGQSNDPSLQVAKRNALTLQGQVGSAVQGAAAQGQQNQSQAQQFGTALQNQLGNTVNTQNNTLQQNATNLQQDRNKQYTTAISDLQSGKITQDEANLLGLTQGENVYNVLNGAGSGGGGNSAAAQFLQENPLAANVSNTASAQDYAKMQALQQLAGQYAPANTQSAFQNFQNPSQANQFQNSQALTGDQSGLQNAISATGAHYHGILDPVQAQADYANQINNLWTNPANGTLGQRFNDVYNLTNGSATGYTQNSGGNHIQDDMAWAAQNAADKASGLATVQNQLQGQYGSPTTINIQPSQYPGIQQVIGNS